MIRFIFLVLLGSSLQLIANSEFIGGVKTVYQIVPGSLAEFEDVLNLPWYKYEVKFKIYYQFQKCLYKKLFTYFYSDNRLEKCPTNWGAPSTNCYIKRHGPCSETAFRRDGHHCGGIGNGYHVSFVH